MLSCHQGSSWQTPDKGYKNPSEHYQVSSMRSTNSQCLCVKSSAEELQRHCEEVHEDVEETIEKQEDRIKKYKKDGKQTFHGRRESCRNYCRLGTPSKANMADERVNGPEDSIVTEMTKQLPQEHFLTLQSASKIFLGDWKKHQFLEDCKVGVPPQA